VLPRLLPLLRAQSGACAAGPGFHDCRWSSYRAHARDAANPPLTSHELRDRLGAAPARAVDLFGAALDDGFVDRLARGDELAAIWLNQASSLSTMGLGVLARTNTTISLPKSGRPTSAELGLRAPSNRRCKRA
jgi:hypothetical protein